VFLAWLALVALAASQVPLAPGGAATTFAAPKTQPAGVAGLAQAAQTYGQWVAALAEPNMEGRGAGTAGLDKARDFLAEHYRRLGLAAPFGESFTQPVEIPLGLKVEKQELAICDANGTRLPAPQTGDFAVLGFSSSKGFSAPAVFVGYGLVAKEHSYDSYAGAAEDALKGKVAVAFRFEPQDKDGKSLWAEKGGEPWSAGAGLLFKAQWAGLRGAEALLVVNPPSQQSADPPRSAGPMPGGRSGRSHRLAQELMPAGDIRLTMNVPNCEMETNCWLRVGQHAILWAPQWDQVSRQTVSIQENKREKATVRSCGPRVDGIRSCLGGALPQVQESIVHEGRW
jgi:hypothetical protein